MNDPRTIAFIALVHASIFAGFLWLQPVIASLGLPERPDLGRLTRKSEPSKNPAALSVPPPPNTMIDYATAVRTTVQTPPAGTTVLAAVEERVFALTNEERGKQGKALVLPDDGLHLVARSHSIDMAVRGYFDHVSLENRTPGDRVAILHRRLVGVPSENIWSASEPDAPQVEELARRIVTYWMKSPGHRENMLNAAHSHLGIGIAQKGKEIRATQVFAEVKAFLQEELPLQVQKDQTLSLLVAPLSGGAEPGLYDFWLPEKGIGAMKQPKQITEARVDLPAGTYRLRLYFPRGGESGGYIIYNAPEVVVE